MVTQNVNRLANQAQDTLEGRDVRGFITVAGSTAVGVITAQSITDRVMGMLGMSADPQNITEFAASIAIKGGVAAGFGVLAANLSGLALVVAAFAGVGALVSAGVDLIDGLLSTAPLAGLAPQQGRPLAQQQNQRRASASASASGGGRNSLFSEAD